MGRNIRILPPLVAQRIAAGEVIERPHSVVRELLDNAIDSGADSIDLYIVQGGIDSIKVIDNGSGMSLEDLQLCCSSHATSKISALEDLDSLDTLGFRGEALSSIAACAQITITSGTADGETFVMRYPDPPSRGGNMRGTSVEVTRLFYDIPGRKKFLKSPQAESSLCRKVFLDKALAHPEIRFRFFANQELKLFLPPGSLFDRVTQAYGHMFSGTFMRETAHREGDLYLQAVMSTPAVYRTDRNYIQVFVNRRRVQEYSLLQAVCHGYASFLPGGAFPYCFLFLTIHPDQVDFNIHPAKREVRFRSHREVHHQAVKAVQSWLAAGAAEHRTSYEHPHREGAAPWFHEEHAASPPPSSRERERWFASIREFSRDAASDSLSSGFTYLGQVFDLFLLAQRDDTLYIIDQHAAHERIIYEELAGNPQVQPLLVPLSITLEDDAHQFLTNHQDVYTSAGIALEHREGTTWELTAVPSVCRGMEQDLMGFISSASGDSSAIEKQLYATIACRGAVLDGTILDPLAAKELIGKAFALQHPYCPHGRPIWKAITRGELFTHVRRKLTGESEH